MQELDWVELDPKLLSHEHDAEIRGAKVKLSLSPFDVPRAGRVFASPDGHRFN